ncbi:hypothetical protein [Sorangium sp. So ce861]|uniref:hypothetical protein n=1 Tax=Sorangium sp. So ce861 TaxID=3133323 RepID=UPI003F63C59E
MIAAGLEPQEAPRDARAREVAVSSSLRRSSVRAGGRGLLVVAALLASACTGPQGGSQTGHDVAGADEGACEETSLVVGSLEEATALGFTAGEVLAQAEGTFESPIVWAPPDDMVNAGPEQGEGEITINVAHGGGAIRFVESRFVESRPRESNDEIEAGPAIAGDLCKSRIEIDVELTIATSGGALAETVPAILSSSDPRHVALEAELDLDALSGSLVLTPQREGWALADLTIRGGMAAGASWGSIGARLEYSDGEVAGAGFRSIASWPTAETCDRGGLPLPLDTALLAFSAADVLAENAEVAATFTWDDGTTTPIALSLEAADDVACVSLGGEFDEAGVRIPARLRLVTEDGRVDLETDVDVYALADAEGRLVDASFQSVHLRGVAPDDFEATYGITGFDVSGYDEASSTVRGTFTGGSSTGALEVLGLTVPECVRDPASNPGGGCEGIDITELGGGTWAP